MGLDPPAPARSAAPMPADAAPRPTVSQIFLTYLGIGLVGFGGVNAWARRMLVEKKRWLTDQDYAEVLGLGQALPGPNALNVAIFLGERWRGAAGALASTWASGRSPGRGSSTGDPSWAKVVNGAMGPPASRYCAHSYGSQPRSGRRGPA